MVENALEHGLDEKEDGEKILCIACLDKGKEILLSVTDNGPGMEPEKAKTLVTYQAKGYGLKKCSRQTEAFIWRKIFYRYFQSTGNGNNSRDKSAKKRSTEDEN